MGKITSQLLSSVCFSLTLMFIYLKSLLWCLLYGRQCSQSFTYTKPLNSHNSGGEYRYHTHSTNERTEDLTTARTALAAVHGVAQSRTRLKWLSSSSRTASEKATAPHSGTHAWKIPWAEEPGGLQSVGSRRVRHDWATSLSLFTFMHWRRKWQPTPVILPGESQGWGSLVGCRLWGRTESDTTEAT